MNDYDRWKWARIIDENDVVRGVVRWRGSTTQLESTDGKYRGVTDRGSWGGLAQYLYKSYGLHIDELTLVRVPPS